MRITIDIEEVVHVMTKYQGISPARIAYGDMEGFTYALCDALDETYDLESLVTDEIIKQWRKSK